LKEYYIIGSAKFQGEWEEKFTKLWSELTVKEQRSLIPIQPPYTEESVVEFLAELRKVKERRGWSFPSFIQRQIPFPTSGVLYWKMVEMPGKNYSIGKYPVTQDLWERVMGDNPSHFKGSSRPVEQVSWFDCVDFCNKLSEKEGLEKAYTINGKEVECTFSSEGYRLPTEEEWVFAAKANQDFEYSGSDNIDEVAWYGEDRETGSTHGVGQKKANGFGLYDMSGNVWEWCWAWFEKGRDRGGRGGSWSGDARVARLSGRYWFFPSLRRNYRGFRLSRTIP